MQALCQPRRLLLGDECAAFGHQLELAPRQQFGESAAVLTGKDLVVFGPDHECGPVEGAQPLGRLEGVARVDRAEHAPHVPANAGVLRTGAV